MVSTEIMAPAPMESEPHDPTVTTTYRDTKDGRRLHYELVCLQQPERARACGSGQKCKMPCPRREVRTWLTEE
jgi:hypothetical protein